jgi:hypothetical protein
MADHHRFVNPTVASVSCPFENSRRCLPVAVFVRQNAGCGVMDDLREIELCSIADDSEKHNEVARIGKWMALVRENVTNG